MSITDSTPPATLVDDAPYQSFEGVSRASDFLSNVSIKSPYTNTKIISIDVGQKQTRFYVHRAILEQSPELYAKSSLKLWGEKSIILPDLDEETAHTLVHFLYTGSYDTLEPHDADPRSALSQYKLGTCAYCAAIQYKLPGLAELAKKTMIALQDDLTIFQVLVVAREHAFPGLPDDETWFSGYLEDAIHAARTKDAELFTRPDFVDQVKGDLRYRQVVMKAIVSSYSVANNTSAAETTVSTPRELDKAQAALSPVVASADHDAVTLPARSGEPVLDEINPTLEAHVAPEPYMDELGWERSKTFQQQSQKAGVQSTAAEKVAPRPGHARVDSLLGVKEESAPVAVSTASDKAPTTGRAVDAKPETVVDIPEVKETAPVVPSVVVVEAKGAAGESEVSSPVANGVDAALSKKEKKNQRKKSKKAAAAAAVAAGASPVDGTGAVPVAAK